MARDTSSGRTSTPDVAFAAGGTEVGDRGHVVQGVPADCSVVVRRRASGSRRVFGRSGFGAFDRRRGGRDLPPSAGGFCPLRSVDHPHAARVRLEGDRSVGTQSRGSPASWHEDRVGPVRVGEDDVAPSCLSFSSLRLFGGDVVRCPRFRRGPPPLRCRGVRSSSSGCGFFFDHSSQDAGGQLGAAGDWPSSPSSFVPAFVSRTRRACRGSPVLRSASRLRLRIRIPAARRAAMPRPAPSSSRAGRVSSVEL